MKVAIAVAVQVNIVVEGDTPDELITQAVLSAQETVSKAIDYYPYTNEPGQPQISVEGATALVKAAELRDLFEYPANGDPIVAVIVDKLYGDRDV